MANGYGPETPASKIGAALATLALAIRLNAEVCQGRIDLSIYRQGVTIHTGGPGMRLPPDPTATQTDLDHGIYNIVQIALGASALTVDEVLDEVFGRPDSASDPNLLGVRVMVHQVRNAFAHNPWRPKWIIKQRYQHVYPIALDNGTAFTFDATNLNGDGLKPDQFGGLESWVQLLQYCKRLVA